MKTNGLRAAFATLCLLLAAGFTALGIWQVERLGWKRDLIAKVERRIHAHPWAMPQRETWGGDHAYRRVRVTGTLLHDHETLVQAVTERGPGWWVMTPLATNSGTLLVNRGFVPAERKPPSQRQAGQIAGAVTITGLLRVSEPGGGFLRSNDPARDRWFSRDVAAIAGAKKLGEVAPFFLDADATPNAAGYPVGGLTVVAFSNNHLIYLLTWFALAGMSIAGAMLLLRPRRDC